MDLGCQELAVQCSGERPTFLRARSEPDPPRQPTPGERLFEFLVGRDRYLVELRDHGPYGIEAQFYRNEEFCLGRRFDPRLDPSRPPRELAIQWAEEIRRSLESGAEI